MRKILCVHFMMFYLINITTAQNLSDFYSDILLRNKNKTFPKTVIYDASQLPIMMKDYLELGFSYVSVYSLINPKIESNSAKYVLWTGVASDYPDSNWAKLGIPYDNNMNIYRDMWDYTLNLYNKRYYNYSDSSKYGIIILDIEMKKSNESLGQNPPFYKGMAQSSEQSIHNYKSAMRSLYNIPIQFAKKKHNNYVQWSSYEDVPVELNWWGIRHRTWEDWTTNPKHLNYITHQNIKGQIIETEFSKNLDFYSVCTYYNYNPVFSNKVWASQYLAYMLFQLEANIAWSKKPIYLYHTFRYQGEKERNTLISKDMVRNSVIFSFISGADGMILYDDFRESTQNIHYHELVRTFIETITELNKYRSYFIDKNVIYFRPENPRDLFVYNKPVIRGIEKDGKLLLAITNTFAKSNEKTNISISYKGKHITVELKGIETYLGEFAL